MKKGACSLCREIIFEKEKCVEVDKYTLCPRCFSTMRQFFLREQVDIVALIEKSKKELCDSCEYNPFIDESQRFYR